MDDYYDYADQVIKYFQKLLIREFSRLKSLVSYDEINVLETVSDEYEVLYEKIRRAFLILAEETYKDVADTYLTQQEKDLISLDEEFVDELLEGYNASSKVVFTNEYDRKRARLVEALIASPTKNAEVDSAMKSLMLMLNTYTILVADESALKVFEKIGVKKVRWIAEMDRKTCPVCRTRHQRVYKIKDLPPKPHFNCRCWFKIVREDVKTR